MKIMTKSQVVKEKIKNNYVNQKWGLGYYVK